MKRITTRCRQLSLLLSFLLSWHAMDARTWYVKTTGYGTDGNSWATAVTLNYALTTAAASDVIWVAGGVYKPDAADRTAYFSLKSGVSMYGGFAGTETTLADRTAAVISTNTTTISGDLDGNDVQGDVASHAANSLHLVVAYTLTAATRFDGFTVKGGGNSNGSSTFQGVPNGNRYGSALFCFNSGTFLTIANCTFTDNISANGGAAYHNNTSPAYFDCSFSNNTATVTGGAMRSLSGGTVSLTRCEFRQNTALSAGAVEITSASVTATDCDFISNSATNGSSGAIQFSTSPAANTLTGCIFNDNSATNAGGALWASASPTTIYNTVFVGNNATGGSSTGGGAILSSNGTAMGIVGCTFYNNTSNAAIATPGKTIKVDATAGNLTLTIRNSIVWSSTDATTIDRLNTTFTATVNATNCDIKDAALYPGVGNINSAPAFAGDANPIGVDGSWGTSDDGLNLTCASPCRNAGATFTAPIPANDIIGNLRGQGTSWEMGAYEFPESGGSISVSIAASSTFICTGTNVTFTATPLNVSGTPTYTWFKTGVITSIGTGSSLSLNDLADAESVYCKMSYTDCAGTPVEITSNTIKMSVETTPTLTLTPSTICLGSPLTATLSAGQMRSFDWKNNGTSVYTKADTVAWVTVAGGVRGTGPANLNLRDGSGNSQTGLFVDNNENVYVVDRFNARVQKWAPGATVGVTVAGGNGQGSALNQLSEPSGLFIDNAGTLYIADRVNARVQKWTAGAASGTTVAGVSGSIGNGANVFGGETIDVAVDNLGNIYVSDRTNHRIQKWAPGAATGTTVAGVTSTAGSTADKINNPSSIFLDAQNNLYIVDQGNHRIQKWAPGATVGVTVAGTGSAGVGANELSSPTTIYIDENQNIYVGDNGNARVQRFNYGSTIGVTVAQLNPTESVGGLYVYKNQIYVTEPNQGRVRAYQFPKSAAYTPLTAGSHTVSVTTRAGCTVNSNAVAVTQVTTAIATTNVLCLGETNGTVTATASGGTAPYTYRLNGAAYVATNVFSGLSVGTYQITSKDANGCTKTSSSVTITQPLALTITTPTAGTIVCNGGTTSISATAGGGTGAYQYSLNGGTLQNSNFFLVQAGTHTIMVQDANGCTTTSSSTTISQPIPVALSAPIVGTITCNGGTTSLSTTASDGVAPYEYKLNTGAYQQSNVFTASAGLNTITARDVNGCMQSVSVTLAEPTAITNTIASGNIACNGGSTTITATAAGGTGTLQYSIDGINYQAANTFTKPAGTYVVTAKDGNGCTRLSNSLTISQPTALAVSIAPAATIPSNGTTTLTATATGGTTPYTYSLNGGAFQAANTFTIPSGRDSVVAKDANGCTQLSSTVIIPNMVVSATKTVLCAGFSNTFTATPTNGGTTPMYQWKKNNVNVGTNAPMYLDAGLVNGDVVRCDMMSSAPSYAMTVIGNAITVTVETQPTATIAPASSCMGTPLAATLSNGTFASVVWKNNGTTIAGATTANYTSTAGGSHTATITTVAGCVATSSVAAVYQVELAINNGNPVKVLCNGGTAGISVVGSGGIAPYQYRLDNGAFNNDGLFTVGAGTYTITGRDVNGCTKTSTVIVTEPPVLNIDAPQAWPIACFGGTTVLSASARGGTYPYEYSLDGFNYQTTINFTVGAGTYQLIVKDINGCTATSALTVIRQPADLIPTATQTAVPCIGGVATVTMGAQGGTAPFTYSFNGSAFGTNRVFTNITAGTYTLSVIDTNLCTKTVNYTVTQPTAVNGSIKVDSVICVNTNTQLVVTGTGGTGALTFSLNGGTPQATPFTVEGGTFNITISDANGCKKVFPPVTVKYAATWTGNTQAVPRNCLGTGLMATYPNPANEFVIIDFKIPSKSVVILKVYDMMGRLIQAMDQGTLKGGSYTSRWSTGNFDEGTVLICLEVDGICTSLQKVRVIRR